MLKIKDREYLGIISELLAREEIQSLINFEHHRIRNRLEHSLHVSYSSFRIAKKMKFSKESLRSIAIGGLLHDLFYYDTTEGKTENHLSEHSEVALRNARKLISLNPMEENIILSHMFGISFKHKPKYKESYVVSVIDKVVSCQEVYYRFRNRKQLNYPIYISRESI